MSSRGQYFNKKTNEINGERKEWNLDDRGMGYVLFHRLKRFAEMNYIAQIDAATGHQDTTEKLLKRCVRAALAMRNFGIGAGDIIGICSYNHLNSIVPYVAGLFLGATIAPTDPTIALADQQHLLNLVQPKIIFVSSGSEELMRNALSTLDFPCTLVSFAFSNKYLSFASFIDKQEGEESFEPVPTEDPTATCLILFSSGTTGLPKGICLNHYFILSGCMSLSHFESSRFVFMLYSTLYWISAICFQTGCLYYGLPRVVTPSFDPTMMWEYVDLYKVPSQLSQTHLCAAPDSRLMLASVFQVGLLFLAPVQAIRGVKHLELKGKKEMPLKVLIMGGSSIAAHYMQELRNLLPSTVVVNGYGQTEVGIISVFRGRDENSNKLDSSGYLSTNMIARIVDPDKERVLGLNQQGEIRIKSLYPMNGYYNQDSSSVWDDAGFIKTGDLGYFDDELCLFVTDRIKEMFKYMSWHIVPAKLEAILQSHPDVQLAIVVGIPHPTEDNHAVGAVTVMPNATVTEEELEKFVEERVDERNRLRAGVVIMEYMPLTPSGKIMRRHLKELLKQTVNLRD